MRSLRREMVGDGARLFAELPQTVLWYEVRDHVGALSGARLTSFLCDGITVAWIDFRYRAHTFSINDQFGEYWFFVSDPECPDEILLEVIDHFETILNDAEKG